MEIKDEKETRYLREQRQRNAEREEHANLKARVIDIEVKASDACRELTRIKEENIKLREEHADLKARVIDVKAEASDACRELARIKEENNKLRRTLKEQKDLEPLSGAGRTTYKLTDTEILNRTLMDIHKAIRDLKPQRTRVTNTYTVLEADEESAETAAFLKRGAIKAGVVRNVVLANGEFRGKRARRTELSEAMKERNNKCARAAETRKQTPSYTTSSEGKQEKCS